MCDSWIPCALAPRFTGSKAGVAEACDNMGEDVFDSGGSESGVVEDTAEDERAVMLVEAADMFVDATDEVLLDGDGDGFGGRATQP